MTGTAFLFPGQGSQSIGMGRALYDALPAARDRFADAEAATGLPLTRLCFEGPEEELRRTEITQPAILLVSVVAWEALRAAGLRPDRVAGHSLGEYSALVAAGSLDFIDAVRTVQSRGRFMQEAVPVGEGAMVAIVGLPLEVIEAACRDQAGSRVVTPANLNGAGQIVISGHADAVSRVAERCRQEGARRVVDLPVSAPFHCELMAPAAERLAPILDGLPFADPAFPVVTNVDAVAVETGAAARDALKRQITAPVRWEESMRALLATGLRRFVEVGPGRVLSTLARRIERGVAVQAVGDPDGLQAAVSADGN